jgi:hypothetical protein
MRGQIHALTRKQTLDIENKIPPNLLKRRDQVAKHAQKQLRKRGSAALGQVGRVDLQRMQTRGKV